MKPPIKSLADLKPAATAGAYARPTPKVARRKTAKVLTAEEKAAFLASGSHIEGVIGGSYGLLPLNFTSPKPTANPSRRPIAMLWISAPKMTPPHTPRTKLPPLFLSIETPRY